MCDINVRILTAAEVAPILGITPLKVENAIRQGSLPIGCVIEPREGTKEKVRIIIPEPRLLAWLNGEDLRIIYKPT